MTAAASGRLSAARPCRPSCRPCRRHGPSPHSFPSACLCPSSPSEGTRDLPGLRDRLEGPCSSRGPAVPGDRLPSRQPRTARGAAAWAPWAVEGLAASRATSSLAALWVALPALRQAPSAPTPLLGPRAASPPARPRATPPSGDSATSSPSPKTSAPLWPSGLASWLPYSAILRRKLLLVTLGAAVSRCQASEGRAAPLLGSPLGQTPRGASLLSCQPPPSAAPTSPRPRTR